MQSRKENINHDYLSNLPDELLVEVGESNVLKASDFINLPNVSKRYNLLFFQEHHLALKCLRQLLDYAALGDWKEAENLWRVFPDLLTKKATIYHKNPNNITSVMNPGRYKYVNLTAWQIAWMNEEYDEVEKMGEVMSEVERQNQFMEIFPDGQLIKYEWDLKQGKKYLNALFAEVVKDDFITKENLDHMKDSTRKALYDLYAYVKPKPEHTMGLIFDPDIYAEALTINDLKMELFNWDQGSFWYIRVEEYLASLLGTAHLRIHTQGIFKFNEQQRNGCKLDGCKLKDGISYFSSQQRGNTIFGYDSFVAVNGDKITSNWWDEVRGSSGEPWLGPSLKDYTKQRREIVKELITRYMHPQTKQSTCSIS